MLLERRRRICNFVLSDGFSILAIKSGAIELCRAGQLLLIVSPSEEEVLVLLGAEAVMARRTAAV